jgi:hypothetical protein
VAIASGSLGFADSLIFSMQVQLFVSTLHGSIAVYRYLPVGQ